MYRSSWFWKGAIRFAAISALICTVIAAVSDWALGETCWACLWTYPVTGILLGIAWTALVMAYYAVLLPIEARKIFAREPSIGQPTTFELDQNGICTSDLENLVKRPWSQATDYIMSPQFVLVRSRREPFLLIPTAQMPEGALNELTALLEQAGVKEA